MMKEKKAAADAVVETLRVAAAAMAVRSAAAVAVPIGATNTAAALLKATMKEKKAVADVAEAEAIMMKITMIPSTMSMTNMMKITMMRTMMTAVAEVAEAAVITVRVSTTKSRYPGNTGVFFLFDRIVLRVGLLF